ncbi:4-sulfomuconolactone hydrolase [Vreelandella titanicae]
MALSNSPGQYREVGSTLPPGSCDCHIHVFDTARFPLSSTRVYTPDEAPVDDLERHLEQLGIERVVIVQASPYGGDNSCLLDAIEKVGQERARGVAVISSDSPTQLLDRLYAGGVRGIRLNLQTYGDADLETVVEKLKALFDRLAPLGWHLQLYVSLDRLATLKPYLQAAPIDIVIDHLGCLDAARGLDQPGFPELLKLLDSGRIYLKLSAFYRVSTRDDYADVKSFIDVLVAARPDRLLWGSDWPHTFSATGERRSPDRVEPFHPEDDGYALGLLLRWIDDADTARTILSDNPARLYWS